MKENNKNSIDDLLVRYLTGFASEEETLEFEQWLASDENNQIYFQKFQSVWESSSKLKDYQEIGVESSLTNVKKRIDFKQNDDVKVKPLWMFVRIAAILVFFFGIYLIFKSKISSVDKIEMVRIEALDERRIEILPDSTVVTLNIASSIEYPAKFEGNERRIKFEGEAYFEVSPDKSKPFIIETSQSETKVVGTAFNLKALANDKTESIVVTEGIVLFSGKTSGTNKAISLKKGEKGVLNPNQKLLKKEANNDLNFMSWKTGIFEFNNFPINEALTVFSGFYKCNFEIADDQVKSYQLSGKYEKLNLEELIDVLEMTINVKIEKSGKNYLIKRAK